MIEAPKGFEAREDSRFRGVGRRFTPKIEIFGQKIDK
jgi:hypothetical protein